MSNVQSNNCTQCGAPIDSMATACKFCGLEVTRQPVYQAPQNHPPQAPQYVPQYAPQYAAAAVPQVFNLLEYTKKSRTTAGILAILLGGIGAHKFYLGKTGMGILYLVFCWTYIPALLGLIEGIIYLTSDDEKFYYKYVRK